MSPILKFLVSLLLGFQFSAYAQEKLPLHQIKLPPGFEISLFTDRVPNARAMVLGDKGTLFVGSMREGKVYAIKIRDNKAAEIITIAQNLELPVGVAFKDGALYISEVNRILRFDNIESNLSQPPRPRIVNDSFPKDRSHGWKFIAFGPDGWLYVPVGAPCNICEPDPKRYANIMRMKPDGSSLEAFATGIRNTVGFAWHPKTKELWFTDNGADWLGDDLPNDELNHAPKTGMNFGYPYCHQGDMPDPNLGNKRKCNEFSPPVQKLGPHVAALGMRFYTGSQFPTEYQNQIFIALHGSWNRSKKSGYRVMRVKLNGNKAAEYEVFAEGWLQNEKAWGRPVDVLVMPDGALLVSDDYAGVIYRISYKGK